MRNELIDRECALRPVAFPAALDYVVECISRPTVYPIQAWMIE
jgi:hypothetical protein